MSSRKLSSENVLLDVVKAAAGVYIDPSAHRSSFDHLNSSVFDDLSRTVLVTAFNYAYLNHIHNFKCFTDRIGLKVL
jgi:hypothetical protein